MEMPLATVAGDETAAVLTEKIHPQPRAMMTHWLNAQTEAAAQRWADRYESLKTPEQIASYQQELSQRFVEELGGFPERTPLNPQVTGVIQREGYRVEKILFESQPRHYVSALCFIPDSPQWQAPYPGVLVVCGHSANGKALAGYQSATALLALNGMVGLIIDPICQGERYQHLDPDGKITVASSTQGHTLVGLGAILLGQNTARFEIWDGMRGIDYLQSREDVDPARIGCMGNSGGGTQTAYLMALDDRIQAASPSCYITSFSHLLGTIGPQDAEQNIHGQLAWGMDHADYLLMRELDLLLAQRHPGRWVPRYWMVTFSRVPYATAFERGKVQSTLLRQFTSGKQALADIDFDQADRVIRERLDPLPTSG